MKKKENMECNQQPFFLRHLSPRCMKTTIPTMTEEQNKQQYESYITSCVHGGQFDMIVSYKEWLTTIQSYKPSYDNSVLVLSEKDSQKFVDIMRNPPPLSDNMKNLLLKRKYEYKD